MTSLNRWVALVVLLAMGLVVLVVHSDDQRQVIRIAGGPSGGGLGSLAVGIFKLIRLQLPEFRVGPPAGTGGSVETARLVGLGQADFGFSSEIAEAYEGMHQWKHERYPNLRTVFTFPYGYQQFFALATSGIRSFDDLKNRRICVGPAGSGGAARAELVVLAEHGLLGGRDYTISWLPYDAGCDALRDGAIDVMAISMTAPTPSVMELAALNEIVMLPLDEEVARRIVRDDPKLTLAEIPPDVYGNNQKNTEPVLALSVTVALATHVGVPDDVVYKITRAHWEHIETFHESSELARRITLGHALKVLPAPLHPGAERYYREIGLWPRPASPDAVRGPSTRRPSDGGNIGDANLTR